MTFKPKPDELQQLGLDPAAYGDLFPTWGGDRRTPDWKQKLAKKRGTKKTRQLAYEAQAPLDWRAPKANAK